MREKSSQVSFKLLKFSDNLRHRPMTNFLRYSHDLSPRQRENSVIKKNQHSHPDPLFPLNPSPQKITTLIQPLTLTDCHQNNGCKIYYDIKLPKQTRPGKVQVRFFRLRLTGQTSLVVLNSNSSSLSIQTAKIQDLRIVAKKMLL